MGNIDTDCVNLVIEDGVTAGTFRSNMASKALLRYMSIATLPSAHQ